MRRLLPAVLSGVFVFAAVLAGVFVFAGVSATPAAPAAAAGAPWWQISLETAPTSLPPGGEGEVLVVVGNLGDAPIDGSDEPVIVKDELPAGLTATAITGQLINDTQVECTLSTLQCSFKGVLYPYERTSIAIRVKAAEGLGAGASLYDSASIEGGGATRVSRTLPVAVGGAPAAFGVASYELAPFNENGTPATQAGAHPFQLTTTLALDETSERYPVALPRDLSFQLPPGLVGDPTAAGQCTMANFFALVEETNLCAPDSVVGVATVTAHEPKFAHVFTKTVPVFNLVPSQGEPARFGFEVLGKVPIVIDTSVRTGKSYEVIASVKDATETAGLLSSQVTLWGVPGAAQHDSARGWECVAGGEFAKQAKRACPGSSAEPERPFLTLPTSCASNPAGEPVVSVTEADSWAEPGRVLGAEYAWMSEEGRLLGFEGCGQLPFSPSIDVVPEEHAAATPSGVEVKVQVPQQSTLEAGQLAEADVRDTTVTLPEGVELSPAAANGLEGCSEEQVGFTGFNAGTQAQEFTDAPVSCPDGSKVGTVRIRTPLLSHELEGALYLASPAPNGEPGRNPFGSLVALYLVAEDPVSGVLVKLAGEGRVDEGTLRVSTSFSNAPQVPFEELTIDLFGGPRASLSTPARCGAYATLAGFTPWSGTGEVGVLAPGEAFQVSSGAEGAGCPSPGALAFAPGFTAYSQSTQAGAFTPFTLELTRPDGDQALSSVSMHLPSGIAALLSAVELCSEAQAAASACPASSEVGRAVAFAGLGSEPYVQEGGRVFITGPYDGAPFGLEIVTPADAGPFDLGYITVRSKLSIDEDDASVTVDSEPLPTEIRGIPLQLKRVLVEIDRAGFEFNPTSCDQKTIEGTITGSEGASAAVSSRFKAENCGALPFAPRLVAGVVGRGSKADGTTFRVTVTSGGVNASGVAQAGIAKVDLQLPRQLSSRLATLQKACTEAAFAANPASCPEGSVIGAATIHTPVLRSALAGPAYLVSHGNAAFPDVEFVLQGEGIKLVLDGKTQIKSGITYSKFESTPDAPFTTFETVLPAGPHGVLTPNVAESKHFDLCGETLEMPTTIVGQNGAMIEHDTKIAIEGCAAVKSAKAKKLTNAQKLAKALAACRKRYKHNKRRRASCERRERKRYPAEKAARKHGKRPSATGKR